MAQLVIGVLP